MKLKESITSNSVKLIDLYNKIESGALETGPDFQRKLVWKKQHKYAFIDTVLSNYPFPEIYIASAEMDIDNLRAKEVVVDGQQRLTTIVDYIKSRGDFAGQKKITSFDNLGIEDKRAFLNYAITVKDLKDIGEENIKEVFKRINSTNYQLNSNEILNAEYGGGEFSMFCKQLADKEFIPTIDQTDIVLGSEIKDLVNTFFEANEVFSGNDKSRMFDVQFLMLIISTIMEGAYYSRSAKINQYLKEYNSEFANYKSPLDKLLNSISIINKLHFSKDSYWFNKANLFSLLVELSKVKEENLDLENLEINLLDLEKKVDIYFNDEDISMITEDERKFFEVSRQGSNGLSEREHRGKVLKDLINKSKLVDDGNEEESLKIKNQNYLKANGIDYASLIPTSTGLKKGIMDAISNVRKFLKENLIHDYEAQEFGPESKVTIDGKFVGEDEQMTHISLYRANGRGDFRIWFTGLDNFVDAGDELALILKNDSLLVLNLNKHDYSVILG